MKLVVDTNIVLDLWVFEDARQAPLAAALSDPDLQWLATAAMRDELERVLGYPLIAGRLQGAGREAASVLAAFDARSRRIDETPPRAPCVCSDADDQKFIDLAVAHGALLLSKDRAVLALRKRLALLGITVRADWPSAAVASTIDSLINQE